MWGLLFRTVHYCVRRFGKKRAFIIACYPLLLGDMLELKMNKELTRMRVKALRLASEILAN
jgi:hypothetical protein